MYMYLASDTIIGTYQLELDLDDSISSQTQLPAHFS